YNGDKRTSDEERQLAYQQWISGATKVLIATTAFSAGNDYAHVRMVIHMDRPFDMVDYIQGQGRAGRDG
ncbi:P-loop containing nucleoside triphosphate hydrolase protein, partial [Pisolithus orientalis]